MSRSSTILEEYRARKGDTLVTMELITGSPSNYKATAQATTAQAQSRDPNRGRVSGLSESARLSLLQPLQMKKAGAKLPAEIIRKYGKSLLTEQNRTEYN